MLDTRRVAIAVVLIALASLSWWIARRSSEPDRAPRAPMEASDYIIEHFTALAHDETGRLTHRLTADKLTHYPADDRSDLVKPYLIQYTPGRAPVHTRADTGVLTDNETRLLMKGHVHSAQGRDPRSAGGDVFAETMRIELDRPARQGGAQGLP